MTSLIFRSSVVVLVLLTLAVLPCVGLAIADEDAPTSVTILTEVWRATDADLVTKIEATTAADPANAEVVHALIAAAEEGKAERISRFLTTTVCGTQVKHDDMAQVPVTSSVRTTGGTVRSGFGGFQQRGTRLTATATEAGNQLLVSMQLSATTGGASRAAGEGNTIPGAQATTTIDGDVAAPSGTLRMFQSSTRGSATFVVFVKATRL